MSFLKADLTTLDVVEGIFPWLVPSEDEVRRCDEAAAGLPEEKILHEYFLLKAAVALEYGQGLLQRLGMRPEGMEQFQAFYVRRLAEGVASAFPSSREVAVGIMAARLKAYTAALQGEHPEDPHLGLADAFTRFCGAADEPALVTLCLDTCKELHRRFLKELSDFGLTAKES